MSVSTPILTTSSEIWAFAAPPDAAKARPAATAAASDFIVSSPMAFVEGFGYRFGRRVCKGPLRKPEACRKAPPARVRA